MLNTLEAKRLAVLNSLRRTAPISAVKPSLPPASKPSFSALSNPQPVSVSKGSVRPPSITQQHESHADSASFYSDDSPNISLGTSPAIMHQSPEPSQHPPPHPILASVSSASIPAVSQADEPTHTPSDVSNLTSATDSSDNLNSRFEQSIYDLNRLGYSYSDILKMSEVSPEVLSSAFRKLGYHIPVVIPRIVPTVYELTKASNIKGSNSSSIPASPINFTPSVPSDTTEKPYPIIPRKALAPCFGSDRWSKHLSITLSDDEEDEEMEDINSDELHPRQADTPKSAPVIMAPKEITRNSTANKIPDKRDIAQTLEAQREKIRQVAARLKLLQQQKTAQDNERASAPPKSSSANGNSSPNLSGVVMNASIKSASTPPTLPAVDGKQEKTVSTSSKFNSKTELLRKKLADLRSRADNSSKTPKTPKEPAESLAISPPMDSQAMVPTDPRIYNLAKSLERARLEKETIANQKKAYAEKLERLNTDDTRKEIEALKEELGRKMNELVDQTYEYATAKASFEATQAQEERLLLGISTLEEQLTLEQTAINEAASSTPLVKEPLMIPYKAGSPEILSLEYTAQVNSPQSNSPVSVQKSVSLVSEGHIASSSSPAISDSAPLIASQNSSDSDVEIIDVESHENGILTPLIFFFFLISPLPVIITNHFFYRRI